MNFFWIKGLTASLAIVALMASCRKKDAPLPDNVVEFESTQQGIAETETSKTVTLQLSRAVNADVPITISVIPSAGLDYSTDFTTTPATASGVITLTALSGSSEVSFTINKTAGALFYGDETIDFRIQSSASPVIIGTGKEFKLTFSEIISAGSSITGNGGGATYGNKVFFDLSANSQVAVTRTNWDLGFYTGNEFRVILNSSTAMMAKQIDKTDLSAVSSTDTTGFYSEVVFNQTDPRSAALPFIDYPTGDLTRTAIAEVSATLTENKVYIVNRGVGIGTAGARGWKKIRVIRNASGGYTLQHADIAATSFSSVDIAKDNAYFFKYVSFENGAVDAEPKKDKWDIAWTYFSNSVTFPGLGEVPYTYQDFVIQNRNVEVAKVMIATKSYEAFSEADLAGQTWLPAQNAIGADWRAGGGPTTAPSVRTDRFYVIKDGNNNYYKLRFTSMTLNAERGFPAFEFVLIRKG